MFRNQFVGDLKSSFWISFCLRYCLFGVNVGLTEKFEANSKPMRIHISETCQGLLSAQYKVEERNDEGLKMKVGGFRSFFLNSKENRKPLPPAVIKALMPTEKEAPKAPKKEAKKDAPAAAAKPEEKKADAPAAAAAPPPAADSAPAPAAAASAPPPAADSGGGGGAPAPEAAPAPAAAPAPDPTPDAGGRFNCLLPVIFS